MNLLSEKVAWDHPEDTALGQPDRDLIAVIAGKAPFPLSRRTQEQSGDLVRQLLIAWQILPSLEQQEIDGALARILLPSDYNRLRNARLAVTAFAKTQLVAFEQLLHALNRSELQYCVLKGSASAFLLYADPYARAAWDVDIGVAQADIRAAETIAIESGYCAAQQDPATGRFYRAHPVVRSAVETKHYELGFLVRRLQVTNLSSDVLEAIRSDPWTRQYWFETDNGSTDAPFCYASVDIHHALSLDIPIDDLLTHAETLERGGLSLKIPDKSWLAAHLIFKLYWEGVHNYGKGLYQYADLTRLIPCLDRQAFRSLVSILDTYRLLVAGHYVLRRLPLFGVILPDHIVTFLIDTATPAAGSDPVRSNDLGDMWPKLWGRR